MLFPLNFRTLQKNELIKNNAIFFVGSLAVAAINYLFYPVLGRFLSPTQFGEVQVLASVSLQVMLLFNVAKIIIITRVSNSPSAERAKEFFYNTEAFLLKLALVVISVSLLLSPLIKQVLQYPDYAPIIVIIVSTLFSVLRSTRDAYLRGISYFGISTLTDIGAAVVKLIAALALVALGWGTFGATTGLAISGAFAAAILVWQTGKSGVGLPLRHISRPTRARTIVADKSFRSEMLAAGSIGIAGLVVALITNLDTVIAKALLPPETAGLYSGISIVSNTILFAVGSIAGVLLSSIKLSNSVRRNRSILRASALGSCAIACSILAVFFVWPQEIVTLLLGNAYSEFAAILPQLGVAMLLLSCSNLIICYHAGLQQYRIGGIAIAGGFCTGLLLLTAPAQPAAIATRFLWGNAILLAGCLYWLFRTERSRAG